MTKRVGSRYYEDPGRVYHWGSGTCPRCATSVSIRVSEEQAAENIRQFSNRSFLAPQVIFPELAQTNPDQADKTLDEAERMRYNAINVKNLNIFFNKH